MDHFTSPHPRDRRLSTNCNNRSWSEEEEAYLLKTRMQKLPYKHIAAHLKKTELACRLHYHQLSHGSHRRKRNSSVCSTISSRSADIPSFGASRYSRSQDYAPITPAHSPRNGSPTRTRLGTGSISHVGAIEQSPGRLAHKTILPKPHPSVDHCPRLPSNGMSAPLLRINTDEAILQRTSSAPPAAPAVDLHRLHSIYESRRDAFWASIALEYGSDVSPAQLEHVWRHGMRTPRPPTPDESPAVSPPSGPALGSSPMKGYLHPEQSSNKSSPAVAATLFQRMPPAPHLLQPLQSLQQHQHQQHNTLCSSPSCSSAVEHLKGSSPVLHVTSAISAPDRMQYILPTPISSNSLSVTTSSGFGSHGINLKAFSWSSGSATHEERFPAAGYSQEDPRQTSNLTTGALPATAISSLLN